VPVILATQEAEIRRIAKKKKQPFTHKKGLVGQLKV
jgi:hypothetical protein